LPHGHVTTFVVDIERKEHPKRLHSAGRRDRLVLALADLVLAACNDVVALLRLDVAESCGGEHRTRAVSWS
jgi:hypothetical protein